MAEVRIGDPRPCKRKGRRPLFDHKINCVAGDPDKYIYEKNEMKKEVIRRRASTLGYSVKTFAADGGGWIIKIS